MAKENIKKFEQLLVSDEALQKKLREATDAYTGDKEDGKAIFDAVVKPLAEEAGLPFTFEEINDFANEDREVSLDEADAVAGGESWCVMIGGGNSKDKMSDCQCHMSLYDSEYNGKGACYYVGVGAITWG